jgi:hypothetical protein
MRHSTRKRPVSVEFRHFEYEGLNIWIERGLDLGQVEIRWAMWGIAVEWYGVIPST